jgi:hypothetical protein
MVRGGEAEIRLRASAAATRLVGFLDILTIYGSKGYLLQGVAFSGLTTWGRRVLPQSLPLRCSGKDNGAQFDPKYLRIKLRPLFAPVAGRQLDGGDMAEWKVSTGRVAALEYSPDGRTLYTGGGRGKCVTGWDVKSRQPRVQHRHDHEVLCPAVSAGGTVAASAERMVGGWRWSSVGWSIST